jgi:hypothetical protein
MIEIDTVRFYLLSLKVKPRLVIRLLISLFRQFGLFFLDKMVDDLCPIPAKGPLPKVLGLSGD